MANTGDNFDLVILADLQGGDSTDATNDSTERIKVHNPFILRNIDLVNELKPRPVFVVIAGEHVYKDR